MEKDGRIVFNLKKSACQYCKDIINSYIIEENNDPLYSQYKYAVYFEAEDPTNATTPTIQDLIRLTGLHYECIKDYKCLWTR